MQSCWRTVCCSGTSLGDGELTSGAVALAPAAPALATCMLPPIGSSTMDDSNSTESEAGGEAGGGEDYKEDVEELNLSDVSMDDIFAELRKILPIMARE